METETAEADLAMACARIVRRMQRIVPKALLGWALLKKDEMNNAKDDNENNVKIWNMTTTATEVLTNTK
jgi:hypothetical protein